MKKSLLLFSLLLLFLLLSPHIHFKREKKQETLALPLEQINGTIFYGPDKNFLSHYEKTLSESQHIDIQTYDITEKRIIKLFKSFDEDTKKIRILMENKKFQQFKDSFQSLKDQLKDKENIQIKSDEALPIKYLHSKITLLDQGFWIQSANLNHSSFFHNQEHFFRSSHSGVQENLSNIFEKDRAGLPLEKADIHQNLLVCPIDCREKTIQLLEGAEESIIIWSQYLSDPELLSLLQQKRESVSLKMIFSKSKMTTTLQEQFKDEELKLISKPYVHTKAILVDGKTLLIGSINLSTNSMDKNREIWILLTDPLLIQEFIKRFEQAFW